MSKEQQKQDFREAYQVQEPDRPPRPAGHGFEGLVRSKVKGGAHTKAALKRALRPAG